VGQVCLRDVVYINPVFFDDCNKFSLLTLLLATKTGCGWSLTWKVFCNRYSMSLSREEQGWIQAFNVSRPPFPKRVESSWRFLQTMSVSTKYLVKSVEQFDLSPTLWTCMICNGIPRAPIMLKKCGHIGCSDCLLENYRIRKLPENARMYDFKSDVGCPVCAVPYSGESMLRYENWGVIPKAMLACVQVRCPGTKSTRGIECSWKGHVPLLVNHEKYECPRRQVKCPMTECQFVGPIATVQEHYEVCDKVAIHCPTCGLAVKWIDWRHHRCEDSLRAALNATIEICQNAAVSVPGRFVPGVPGALFTGMMNAPGSAWLSRPPMSSTGFTQTDDATVDLFNESIIYNSDDSGDVEGSNVSDLVRMRYASPVRNRSERTLPQRPILSSTPTGDIARPGSGLYRHVRRRRREQNDDTAPATQQPSASNMSFVDVVASLPEDMN